jgi:hypothetical protein
MPSLRGFAEDAQRSAGAEHTNQRLEHERDEVGKDDSPC